MRKRMVGGFNDVEEAVSVSAATSEAKQEASVLMLFQVLPCGRRGDETASAMVVGSHIALVCLEASPTCDPWVAGLKAITRGSRV